MSEFLSRFTFQANKMTMQIWVVAAFIWIVVLSCAIASLFTQPFTRRQRIAWIFIIVGVPIFGLLAYLPFSIRRDELPTAFLMRGGASKDRKKNQSRSTTVLPPPR